MSLAFSLKELMTIESAQQVSAFGLKYFIHLGKRSWWLSLVLWVAALAELAVGAAPAQAELEMRVAIEQGQSQIAFGSSTPAVIKDTAGRVLAQLPAGIEEVAEADAEGVAIDQLRAGAVWVEPTNGGLVAIGDEGGTQWYRGRALIVPTSGGLTAVNYVDLDQYLYSVVGSEMPTSWHPEALKAQAVAARSYALFQRQTSANTVFDVGDTPRWQAYGGADQETSSTIAAVDATAGQVMTYDGQIINAVFHSSSGGHTENVEDVWVQPLPYLRGVPDFDQDAPVYQWVETFTADQLRQRITGIGNILSFTPERLVGNRRVDTMRVRGDQGSREISGDDLRQALGLKSTFFRVIPQGEQVASAGNVPTAPVSFQIAGQGFGHGLGMSQYGAYGLARRGYSYQQIVSYYYTGATLARIQVR
jgi:stage II sporulation protein D